MHSLDLCKTRQDSVFGILGKLAVPHVLLPRSLGGGVFGL